jgi:uncharacterized protein (TIGR00251 family)
MSKPSLPKWLIENPEGVILQLKVQPNASRSEISGEYKERDIVRLKIRVSAPPVEDAANRALLHFLKKTIGVSSSCIHLLRGEVSRSKDVLIQGISAEEIAQSLHVRKRGNKTR